MDVKKTGKPICQMAESFSGKTPGRNARKQWFDSTYASHSQKGIVLGQEVEFSGIKFVDGFRDFGWIYGITGRKDGKGSFREVEVKDTEVRPSEQEIVELKRQIAQELF